MSDVEAVCGPKALAASHLWAATSCVPLVSAAFSSWISILGSMGQYNYVAANASVNAMALMGRSSGRCDFALLLPPVSGLGMSAALFASTSTQLQSILHIGGVTLDQYASYLATSLSGGSKCVAQSPLP